MSYQTILAIGTGGFIGAILRVYLNGFVNSKITHTLPFGTLGVNLLGSLLMGALVAYFFYSSNISIHTKSFLTTGILGALTTYSTFAIESFLLLQGGSLFYGFLNMFLNVFGSISFTAIGYFSIHYLFKNP